MEVKINKKDWIFLILCLLLGVIAEESFFRGQIGISYLVFMMVFYSLFFWRFRTFSFTHQRVGYLILIVVWLLASGYYLNDSKLFYVLNIVVIPSLVILHLTLITSPRTMKWNQMNFIFYGLRRIGNGFVYNSVFSKYIGSMLKRGKQENHYDIWKNILIGVVISIPFLFIVLNLLISADSQFERIIGNLPELFTFKGEYIIRVVIVIIFTLVFFGYMSALLKMQIVQKVVLAKPMGIDGVIALTVLVLLNLVYVLFVAVQFKYFFNGTLGEGYTYAEYARRGFFELLFVTLINLTVTMFVIQFTKSVQGVLKKTISLALTLLVLSSGVLLTSAFMRLTMYEEAYGFTFTRILAHSFMIFLMVIFAYTLLKIWLEKLSLFHFYFVAALIYYTGINVVNLDQIVVERNLDRYEETGKIDISYLNSMSATGILGLISLYKENPEVLGLREMLMQRKAEREHLKSEFVQSHNLERERAYERLGELN